MVGRRRAVTAFRPTAPNRPRQAPSRTQTAVLLAVVLAVAAGITVASFVVRPDKARSFDLVYGSVFVDDNLSPVAIDLSSGKATVRLSDAQTAVSAERSQDLDVVPVADGTLMLDATTGEFNMLDSSGFVLKSTGGGVRLPQLPGAQNSRTTAVPSGDSAYLVRPGATGTAIYLVGQSTVAAAVGVPTPPEARAQATLQRVVPDDPDAMAAANGELFLLTGAVGSPRRLVRLSVPAGSNAGVALTVRRSSTVTGVAALSSATANADGTGDDVVGLASQRSVQVVTPDGRQEVPVRSPGDVDTILPVRDAQGALLFLYHATDGWYLVRVPVDGGNATTSRVEGIASDVGLITPVASSGRVYTLGNDALGSLFEIGPDGTATPIDGAAHYPLVDREPLTLEGAELTADGSRVIFDSRANFRAVVVFSDGSHPTRIVDKHSAVQVDTNGAASIAGGPDDEPDEPEQPDKPKPQPHPEQAVNDRINCKAVSQTPHIPSVQLVQRASRSVQLQWEYPVLDPQDCDPSTYTVAVKLVSGDAPSPPATITVQGQTGVNLTGLFPDSKYEIVVTAYINKLHTPSVPLVVTTSVEGPAAPTRVRTSVDDSGNWTVTWNSCGGVQSGCVPTADWQIIPHLCDGVGLSSAPDTRRRVGDPTQHTFSFTYEGSESLLGRGLSFDVQGIGVKGTIGDSAGDGSCSYSWTPTVPKDISIHASAPPETTGESTTQTTVSVEFANGQQHDLGGLNGELTYELLQGDSVVARVGPTTKTRVALPGIAAGRSYQAAVVVNPARHRSATERIGPIDVRPAIAVWPRPTVTATVNDTAPYTGRLIVTVDLPPGTNTHGETFDLTPNSNLRCGNYAIPLTRTDIEPGRSMSFDGIDRTRLNSQGATCSVAVALQQNPDTISHPPLYGDGTKSAPANSGPIHIDVPALTAGQNDFAATWNSSAAPGHPVANVAYNGGDDTFLQFARLWQFDIVKDSGTSHCGSTARDLGPGNNATTVDVDKTCIKEGGNFSARLAFSFYGTRYAFTVPVNGSAPTPVDAGRFSFAAEWVKPLLRRSEVRVELTSPYDQQAVNALDWTYSVTSDQTPGTECIVGRSYPAPDDDGSGPVLLVDFTACPQIVNSVTATYTLNVVFTDPNYGVVGEYHPIVAGAP